MIKLTFNLEPVAKGRPRMSRSGHAYTPEKTREFEKELQKQARKQHRGAPLTGALKLVVTYFMRAPKKRVRVFPTTKPDLDNLIKPKDALNGIIWEDDSQIIEIHARKVYASGAGHIAMEVVSV